jgi:hypothetical protein
MLLHAVSSVCSSSGSDSASPIFPGDGCTKVAAALAPRLPATSLSADHQGEETVTSAPGPRGFLKIQPIPRYLILKYL